MPAQENQNNPKTVIYGLVVVVIILLIVICGGGFYFFWNNSSNNNSDNSNNSSETTPTSSSSITYENSYLKIKIPTDWTYSATPSGSLNITKGNYILFINPYFQQASGVQGARYAEIAQGAPGSDLVVKSYPADPCGSKETNELNSLKRSDYYISSSETSENCNTPTTGEKWYFSYVSDGNGYVTYYQDSTASYVITMTYKTTNVAGLPDKNDSDLKQRLDEMSEIIKTLELKNS